MSLMRIQVYRVPPDPGRFSLLFRRDWTFLAREGSFLPKPTFTLIPVPCGVTLVQ